LIYINDLADVCDNFSKLFLFAHDDKFYSYIKNAYVSMHLQHNINKLHQWTQNWELALNIDKCAVCRFGRNIAIKSDYYISDIKLQEVYTVKDLGVTFDE